MDDRPDPQDVRHVRGAYPGIEGINRAADAVEATLATEGWRIIMELCELEAETISNKLDGARDPLPQATYAARHGRRGGIRTARRVADALLKDRKRIMDEQRKKHEGGAESPEGG